MYIKYWILSNTQTTSDEWWKTHENMFWYLDVQSTTVFFPYDKDC